LGKRDRLARQQGVEVDRIVARIRVSVEDRLPQAAGQLSRACDWTVADIGHSEDAQQAAVFQCFKPQ
jgi:hypothetical protein